jgi:hypothetical protein
MLSYGRVTSFPPSTEALPLSLYTLWPLSCLLPQSSSTSQAPPNGLLLVKDLLHTHQATMEVPFDQLSWIYSQISLALLNASSVEQAQLKQILDLFYRPSHWLQTRLTTESCQGVLTAPHSTRLDLRLPSGTDGTALPLKAQVMMILTCYWRLFI